MTTATRQQNLQGTRMSSQRLSKAERDEISSTLKRQAAKEIAAIESTDPEFRERFAARLRKRAVGLLKVDRECAEVKRLENEINDLERKKLVVEKQITAKMPKNKIDSYGHKVRGCPSPMGLCDAISDIEQRIEPAEKAKDSTGKKIVAAEKLAAEKMRKFLTCITREDVATAKIL